jgi:hypothetical protein
MPARTYSLRRWFEWADAYLLQGCTVFAVADPIGRWSVFVAETLWKIIVIRFYSGLIFHARQVSRITYHAVHLVLQPTLSWQTWP